MEVIACTIGMAIRAVLVLLPSITKWDWLKLAGILGSSIYFAGQAKQILAVPILFASFIAIIFRTKIIPVVTEGTVLLYALLASFLLYVQIVAQDGTLTTNSIILAIIIFPFTFFAIIASFRKSYFNDFQEIVMMLYFFFLNIFIAYSGLVSLYTSTTTFSFTFYFFLGFFYLQVLCHIVYACTFFIETAVQGVHVTETMKQKFANVDLSYKGTLTIFILFGLLLLNTQFNIVDSMTAIAGIASLGAFVTSSEKFY